MSEHFFQKTGQDMLKGNLMFMKLPWDIKGMYFEMRLMVDDQTWKDGTFPLGASKRATIVDFIAYCSDGTKAQADYVRQAVGRLVQSGIVRLKGHSEVIELTTFTDEQKLGNPEANRKREAANLEMEEMVNKAGAVLKGLFRRTGAVSQPYDVLINYLRGEGRLKPGTRVWTKTAQEVLSRMLDSGILFCRGDGGLYSLASLAPPPNSGSGAPGTDFSGPRKIPVDPELEPELEGDFTNPQLATGQVVRRPNDAGASPGAPPSDAGGGGASEARKVRNGAHQRRTYPTCDEPADGPDWMYEPSDANQVHDPVHAARLFLVTKPGWCEKVDPSRPEKRPSKHVLLSKWKESRLRLGPREADRLWRDGLREIFTDHFDAGWENWTGLFVSRITKALDFMDNKAKET